MKTIQECKDEVSIKNSGYKWQEFWCDSKSMTIDMNEWITQVAELYASQFKANEQKEVKLPTDAEVLKQAYTPNMTGTEKQAGVFGAMWAIEKIKRDNNL